VQHALDPLDKPGSFPAVRGELPVPIDRQFAIRRAQVIDPAADPFLMLKHALTLTRISAGA
jgi:hypothetical protein